MPGGKDQPQSWSCAQAVGDQLAAEDRDAQGVVEDERRLNHAHTARSFLTAVSQGPPLRIVPLETSGYTQRISAARAPALFGQVMWLVALTVGVATLAVYLFREAGGALWFFAWIAALGCLVALTGVVDTESAVVAIRETMVKGADVNVEAFWKGYAFINGKDYV